MNEKAATYDMRTMKLFSLRILDVDIVVKFYRIGWTLILIFTIGIDAAWHLDTFIQLMNVTS